MKDSETAHIGNNDNNVWSKPLINLLMEHNNAPLPRISINGFTPSATILIEKRYLVIVNKIDMPTPNAIGRISAASLSMLLFR